ncbi:hypothetical protein Tco_1241485, partial [Tanacetum coccineum]
LIYETIEANFETVLKEKRELEDMLKENMEMRELFHEDEKFELFVKKFKEEFTTDCAGHRNDEDEAGHANHGYVHANDDGNSRHVDADTNMFAASDTEKKSADKEDKEKAQMEKNAEQIAAEKEVKMEEAQKIAAAEKQVAEKARKEKADKEAAKKKKAEMEKAEAKKKEEAKKKLLKYKLLKGKRLERKLQDIKKLKRKNHLQRREQQQKVMKLKQLLRKMVKTQDKLDEDEIISARSIFCMQGDISEVVLDDGKGIVAHKKGMQSLTPSIIVTPLNSLQRKTRFGIVNSWRKES